MANETDNASAGAAGSGELTDDEILAGFGLDGDANELDVTEDGVDTSEDEESEDDAGGENDGEGDEADDASEDDAEDSEAESDDDAEESEDEESEEEDGDDEEEGEKLPRSVEALQKRVNKLTARAKGAEAERDQVRAQVTELQTKLEKAAPVVLQPGPGNPLADLTTEEAVVSRLEQFKALKRWCRENPEGGTLKNAKGEDVEVDAKGVRQRLDYADEMLTEYGPSRLQFLKLEQSVEPAARKAYPALFEDGSEERKIMDSFLRVCPELLRLPNYRLIIGDSIRGMRERTKAETAGKKPGVATEKSEKAKAPEKKPAPRAIKPAPARTTTQQKATTSKHMKDFTRTGDKRSLENWVLSTL